MVERVEGLRNDVCLDWVFVSWIGLIDFAEVVEKGEEVYVKKDVEGESKDWYLQNSVWNQMRELKVYG